MIGAAGGHAAASTSGVIGALAPAFAAGFAVQQLLELFDPALNLIPRNAKKWVTSLIALGVGLALAAGAGLHVLDPLGVHVKTFWDDVVTGIFISGGTQGFNSVLKFLGYAKENKKAQAAHQRSQPGAAAHPTASLDRV